MYREVSLPRIRRGSYTSLMREGEGTVIEEDRGEVAVEGRAEGHILRIQTFRIHTFRILTSSCLARVTITR